MSFLARRSSSFRLNSPRALGLRAPAAIEWSVSGPWLTALRAFAIVPLLLSASACGDGEEAADADAETTTALSYCDVAPIIAARCLRCHGEELENFAPFPLNTFDAIHAPFRPGGDPIWMYMERAVRSDAMPPVTLFPDLEPPVEPLTPSEKDQLLDWLGGGAPLGDCRTGP